MDATLRAAGPIISRTGRIQCDANGSDTAPHYSAGIGVKANLGGEQSMHSVSKDWYRISCRGTVSGHTCLMIEALL